MRAHLSRVRTRIAAASVALAAAFAVSTGTAHAAGMPQLDIRNPLTLAQVGWGAVIFLVLYILLSRSALPKVERVLADRRAAIDADLDTARNAKTQADQAIAELRAARGAAAREAHDIVARMVAEAKDEAAGRLREMNTRLDYEAQAAEARLAAQRDTALGSLGLVAGETAQTLITKLTGQQPDAARVEAAVAEGIAARPALQPAALQPA